MEIIKIPSSKRKKILLILGLLIVLILEIPLIINSENYTSTLFKSAIFIKITSIIGALITILALIIYCSIVFTKKMDIIISEKGIEDNSSYVSIGMIFWDDITSIKHIDVMSTKFLIINVRDPDKYINKQSNFKKKLLRRNLKTYGSPISISSNALSCDFNELEKIILKYYNENK
ncbi:hypothetical protein QE422_003532 [Chryseobacterium sp. SORGH_AS 447]|uniref:STM3941 family protein n=1 Tax=Chryseobacterium sp. SORGH_AS_0447 TaxID=3041769 RepID=UPI00277E4144|nr:STM3941 family protein [Chryseobacterium sp. SORGH_AS_0447]MDQ1163164.1 hypothetical protein [Chryseobacterium sp. SORGH_AS_0447]